MVKPLDSEGSSRTRAPATYKDRTPVLHPSEPNKAPNLWESILCEDPNNPTAIKMILRRVRYPDSFQKVGFYPQPSQQASVCPGLRLRKTEGR